MAVLTVCFIKGRYFIWQNGAIARVFWAPATEITDLVYFLLFGSIIQKLLSMENQLFSLKIFILLPLGVCSGLTLLSVPGDNYPL
jgi:hypothetical protein